MAGLLQRVRALQTSQEGVTSGSVKKRLKRLNARQPSAIPTLVHGMVRNQLAQQSTLTAAPETPRQDDVFFHSDSSHTQLGDVGVQEPVRKH